MASKLSLFIIRHDTDNPAADPKSGGLGGIPGRFDMVRIFCDGDVPAMANWLLQNDPHVIVSVRNMRVLEDPFDDWPRTADNAARLWEHIKEYRKQFIDKRRVVFCLPPNEPTVDGKSAAETAEIRATLDAWWRALAAEAQQDNCMIGMGNWSAHVRLYDKWQDFEGMLEACLVGGHYWDQHGYAPGPNILDTNYRELLMPWQNMRARLLAAGRTDLAKIKIMAGEFGEDRDLIHETGSSGYRLTMSNESYAGQLISTIPMLRADNVSAFIYGLADAQYTGKQEGDDSPGSFVDYNIIIGAEASGSEKKGNYKPADPSVLDRIMPAIIAQTGGGPIEIPPPLPEPPAPDTPPVNPPVKVVIAKGPKGEKNYYNLRLTPKDAGANNLITAGLLAGRTVHPTGRVQNKYSEVGIAAVLDDSELPIAITGWVLTSGLQNA